MGCFGLTLASPGDKQGRKIFFQSETISRNGEAINQLTDGRIVFDSKIDMFLDTEAKGTSGGEVAHLELVFLDLESLVEDLFGLGASDSAVARDLFVTSDTEGSDGVSGLRN